MQFWMIFCFAVLGVYAGVYLLYIAVLSNKGPRTGFKTDKKISILVAARNEEANIEDCLKGLSALEYPVENLEILIGDDRSEDSTAELIKNYIKDKPQFSYHYIAEDWPGQKGKQNVLAQLVRKSKGEILLVTDADITVSPRWAGRLVATLNGKVAMVSGATLVTGNSLFAHMQTLDWMMGIGAAAAHARIGIPITAVGNNMAVTREAYDSCGGYEKLDFSITEDYKLFQALCEKCDYEFAQLLDEDSLNQSKPIGGIKGWLHQRRRWFRGGSELPWYNVAFLLFNGVVMPTLIAAAFFIPLWWIGFFVAVKTAVDFLFLFRIAAATGMKRKLIWFPLYEIYYQVSVIVTPLNYLAPAKVNWKGRKY